MQKIRLILLASGLALVMPIFGYAQSISDIANLSPEDRRAYMESMSPDERAAMREKWHNERASMSDEERAAFKANRRAQWESMSDEERAAIRAKRQENHAKRREKWQSMSDEERAAAREKTGKHKYGGKGNHRRHKGEDSDTPE